MPLKFSPNSQNLTAALRFSTNPAARMAGVGLIEATEAEAEAGAILGRYMSPLRTNQAIAALDNAIIMCEATGSTDVTGGTPGASPPSQLPHATYITLTKTNSNVISPTSYRNKQKFGFFCPLTATNSGTLGKFGEGGIFMQFEGLGYHPVYAPDAATQVLEKQFFLGIYLEVTWDPTITVNSGGSGNFPSGYTNAFGSGGFVVTSAPAYFFVPTGGTGTGSQPWIGVVSSNNLVLNVPDAPGHPYSLRFYQNNSWFGSFSAQAATTPITTAISGLGLAPQLYYMGDAFRVNPSGTNYISSTIDGIVNAASNWFGQDSAGNAIVNTPTNKNVKLGVNGIPYLFVDVGKILIGGSTSGSLTIKPPAAAGSNTLTLPAGTTDFSATGGSSQVVKQTSAGGAFTVAQLATTDISTALASGSVAFANGSILTGNSSNLYWDNSNFRLGVNTGSGTGTPGAALTVNANASGPPTPQAGVFLHFVAADGNSTGLGFDGFAQSGVIDFRRSQGTKASPSAIDALRTLALIGATGYGQTGYSSSRRALISLQSSGAWTDTDQGTQVIIQTTASGGTTTSTKLTLNSVGDLILASTTASTSSSTGAVQVAGGLGVAGAIYLAGKLGCASFVVASLPSGSAAGETVYASNCRVFNGAGTQEGAGVGTGGLVNYNGTAWKIAGTNVTAVA